MIIRVKVVPEDLQPGDVVLDVQRCDAGFNACIHRVHLTVERECET